MAVSKVSICSNALLQLGDKPIASFAASEGDKATLCANLWDQVRDHVLRRHVWPCTRKAVILAPSSTAPAFDWGRQFPLPADWLRTLQVGERGEFLRFEQLGRRILANVDALPLIYQARVEDVSEWDAMLIDVMCAEMAARLAYPITQSASLAELKRTEANVALREAKSVAGQDNEPEEYGDSPFTDVRY